MTEYREPKNFMIYLTGKNDNDRMVEDFIRKKRGDTQAKYVHYKLDYVPPYEKFKGIAHFERMTQYHPFCDSLQKKAIAIINLSEWMEHQEDEYLEIFLKFLHDYDWSFYQYDYVFTVGDTDKMRSDALYRLISQYLDEGKMIEDKTMTDEKRMKKYLALTYPVNHTVGVKLAHIFVQNKVKDYVQLNMMMNDFVNRTKKINHKRADIITENDVRQNLKRLENSKLSIIYADAWEEWKQEMQVKQERGEGVA